MVTELKNDFRKEAEDPIAAELARVGEAEMMRRDMIVSMRNLQFRKSIILRDQEHYAAVISAYEAFVDELAGMPVSEAREGAIAGMSQQLSELKKQIAGSAFARASVVMLEALEMAVSALADEKVKAEGNRSKLKLADDDTELDEIDIKETI